MVAAVRNSLRCPNLGDGLSNRPLARALGPKDLPVLLTES